MEYWSEIMSDLIPDCVLIWEDMASKTGSLISPDMVREFMLPYYVRIIDFLKQHDIRNIHVDSDGYIENLIPLWNEVGVTGIFPFEIQAGNNLLKIRDCFPNLQMLGGIDKRILTVDKKETHIDKELEKVKIILKTGGYVPHMDHHIPDDASWKNFKYYRMKLNEIIEKSIG
jgi:uroporphyrinogen decarboxylase